MSEAQMDIDNGIGKLVNAGRSLWLAGLGAVAGVEEGTRDLFGRLVERGRPVEERQKKMAEAVADRANRTAQGLGQLVQDTVEYESREMLKRLNVMTRDDVKILAARLETLSKKLDEYAARKEALAAPLILTPADLTPEDLAAAPKPKAARPRQHKTKTVTTPKTKTTTTRSTR
jgi:poly(hydroxyalkanoate) granule-associated protein